MDNTDIDRLLDKLAVGESNAEEEAQAKAILHLYAGMEGTVLTDEDHMEADRLMWMAIEKAKGIKVRRLRPWRTAVAAAIATMIFGAGLFYFIGRGELFNNNDELEASRILPGKQGATLTLANGKKIKLNVGADAAITQEAGIKIHKTGDGMLVYEVLDTASASPSITTEPIKYNTLSTAKGETYQVKLPDGSMVYLNAASSLKYPSSMANAKERRVELHGEGYFEIAKLNRPLFKASRESRRVPFIVMTDKQQVEVLGTHFNINSYEDNGEVTTTLLEGSVRVSAAALTANKGADEVILHPDQQAVLSAGNKFVVQAVNSAQAIAWKNGYFEFENASIETVLRDLARWYDLDVVYTGKMPKRAFTGKIYRNITAAEARRILRSSKINFKIDGNKIIVSP